MLYQGLVSLQVLGLYLLLPPTLFCQFSSVSSADIFIFIPQRFYHHFIISNRSTHPGQKPLIYEDTRSTVRAGGMYDTNYLRAIIWTRLSACVCVNGAAPRLHVTTHTHLREERRMKEKEKKRKNNSSSFSFFFFFFKAAHYPAVSGCMAPSQNIMMRINSPGTTSFCWRPSQGSASVLPPSNSFPLFLLSPLLPSSLTHWCLCHVIRWWGARQRWLHIAHH